MKVSTFACGRVLALCALAVCAAALFLTVPLSAQGFKWWQDEGYKRELRLTPEQTTRLEEIFQKSLPTLRQHKQAFDRAQAEFDRVVERGEDGAVMEQVNTVETTRAELNKARIMMLLRMRRTLTADQWAKFTAMNEHDRAQRERPADRR